MGRVGACVLPVVVTVGGIATACGPDIQRPATVLVTDSGGVTVVESTMPRWTDEERWWVDSVPEVLIGGLDPGEEYAFGDVDGVTRFPDGRIVVLDGDASVVRVYDPAGEHLFDVGGPGEGPEEFRRPQFVGLVRDTIVVYDQVPPRASWFDDTGVFVRSVPLARTSGRRQLYGPAHGLLDGDGVVITAGPPAGSTPEPGVTNRPRGLWRLALDGSSADSLAELRGEDVAVQTTGRFNRLTFGSTTHVTASDAWIFVADSRSYSVQVRDRHGTATRVIRRAVTPRAVTGDDLDRYARQLVLQEGLPEEFSISLRQRLDDVGAASEMPVLRMIAADLEGYLWVEEWQDVGLSQGPFSVFDPAGAWLGTVDLPAGLPDVRGNNRELEIGSDYVLGVWADSLDVQQVRLYRLHKPGRR